MSEQWNGKKCPSCFQGTLEQRVKPTQFEYRGRVMEFPRQRRGAARVVKVS
jgi:hypothetical protein